LYTAAVMLSSLGRCTCDDAITSEWRRSKFTQQ